jgi:hypothetical protein
MELEEAPKTPSQSVFATVIADASLRKKVCFKVADILQKEYKFEDKKAKEITVKMESKARRKDP